jgi:hypothetical protein
MRERLSRYNTELNLLLWLVLLAVVRLVTSR